MSVRSVHMMITCFQWTFFTPIFFCNFRSHLLFFQDKQDSINWDPWPRNSIQLSLHWISLRGSLEIKGGPKGLKRRGVMGGQGIGSKGVKRSSDRIKRCQKGTWRGSTGDLRGPRGTCGGPGGSKEVKGVLEGEWVHIEMIWCDCAMITQWFSKRWHEIPWWWWWLTKWILWPRSYSLSWSKKSAVFQKNATMVFLKQFFSKI